MRIAPLSLDDPAECVAAWRLQRAAYAREAALIGSTGMAALRERVADLAANRTERFDGAWAEPRTPQGLLGLIVVEATPEGWLISRLAIDPRHLRRGVARALLRHVVARHGAEGLRVSTGEANSPARGLYESEGFVIETRGPAPDGTPLARYRLAAPRLSG